MLIKKALKPSMESITEENQDELSLEKFDSQVDDDVQEAEDADNIFSRLHYASVSLEEIRELIVESQKEEGMSAQTAQAVGIALEHIDQSLGFVSPNIGVSLEDFDGSARQNSTSLVLESVTETLQKVWKTILEFMDKMIAWCKKFIHENFNYMGVLSKQADKIKTDLAHVKTFKMFDIEDEGLCKRLYSLDVKENSIVPAYHDAMATISNSFAAANSPGVQNGINVAFAWLEKGPLAHSKAKDAIRQACDAYSKEIFGNDTTKRHGVPEVDNATVYSTPIILGGIGWYFVKPNFDLNQIKIASYRGPEGRYEFIRSFSANEIKYILASFKTAESIHHEFKKDLERLEKYRKNFNDYVRGTSENLTGSQTGGYMVSGTVRAAFKMMIGMTNSTYIHLIKVTKDMFKLCDLSIKAAEQHESSSSREMVAV